MYGGSGTQLLESNHSPARLVIRLLGTPHASVDGRAVLSTQTPKVLALLAYLAVEGDRAHPRSTLAALFWPDAPEAKAHQDLRQVLARLRQAIGEASAGPAHLLTDARTIRFLSQSSAWLDVATFSGLVDSTERHPHRRLAACRTCLAHLAEAADLYRGEFLAGLRLDASWALDEWVLIRREELQQKAVRALEALTSAHLAHGEFETACRYARQLLSLDPWNEAAERMLLRALLAGRGRNVALRQYRAFARALGDELGIEPEDETRALLVQIREGTWSERKPRTLGPVPMPTTPCIGREREIAQVSQQLEERESRMLTLCGPGGCGKSRLALEVAERQAGLWQHGVWFLPLAEGVTTQQGLAEALATALSTGTGGPARPPDAERLIDWLCTREMLLILDGYERLAGDTHLPQEILRRAPEVRLLVTSRTRLGVRQERALPLGGLDLPAATASPAEAEKASAVQLFVAGAQGAAPDFRLTAENLPAVSRICHLVEGLPLGIVLAAAWVRILPVDRLATEIERSPELARAPDAEGPPGPDSLRETFETSYSLLPRAEQALFRSLSVFHAGFTPAAARAVAGAELPDLAALHDASLLQALPLGRLGLHRALREFASARLAAQPAALRELQELHSRYYLALLRQNAALLSGGISGEATKEIYAELGNIGAAWQWAASQRTLHELDGSLEPLSLLYTGRGLFQQALDAFAAAAECVSGQAGGEEAAEQLAARLLAEQASCLKQRGSYADAGEMARRAVDAAQAGGDRRTEARARFVQGEVAWRLGQPEPARGHLEQAAALARDIEDPSLEIDCLRILAGVCWRKGDYAGAAAYLEDCLRLALHLGDRRQQGIILCNLGVVAVEQSDFGAAAGYYEQALHLDREGGDRDSEGVAVSNAGNLRLYLGAYAEAEQYYRDALEIHRETGSRASEAWTLGNLGLVLHYQGRDDQAMEYCREAVRRAKQIGDPAMEAAMQMDLGHALLGLGRWEEASAAYGEAAAIRRAAAQANLLAESLAGLAESSLAGADLAGALSYVEEILHHLMQGEKALAGTIDPFQVWLACYRTLTLAGDARAGQVLDRAGRSLQECAGRIADEAMRRSFLENVAAHRELGQRQAEGQQPAG